jgi:hypothetical protein
VTRRPTPPHRHIYVIGPPVGLQKVGIATDPKARLATLQTAVPFDLHLHLAIAVPFDDAHVIERRAHRLLARSCVRNEWFETSPAEAIAAVQTAVEPRPMAKPAAPTEWRLSPAERKPVRAPDVAPLVEAGRQFRPKAAFHKAAELSPLPLFDYVPPARGDEQALVDRVLDAVMRRMAR